MAHNPTPFGTVASLHGGILIKLLFSVSIQSPISSKQDAPLHRTAFDCSFADYYDFCDNIRDVPWEGKLDFGASVVIIEFCG